MSDEKQAIHKLIIKPRSAKTLCGKEVIAFYPMSMHAMTEEAGQENIKVTLDKGATCEVCRKNEI